MKKLFNTLHKYILEYSVKDYTKETVNGLFRSIMEPVCSNLKYEALVLLKLNDATDKESVIGRLNFSNAKVVSYSSLFENKDIKNSSLNNIWGSTEFAVVIGSRYSSVLIWDYSLGDVIGKTPVCLLFNSKIISEVSRCILDNSEYDFKDFLSKYTPDRRENSALNKAINNISVCLNDKNEELLLKEAEGNSIDECDDELKTARVVCEKAKFIAHEIKNNLSVINLYSTIVKKRLEKISVEDDIRLSFDNAIRNLENSSERISYLINDLRCFSDTYISEFNLKDVVLNIIHLCEDKAKKAGVDICCGDISDVVINSDKAKIECAVMNVIFNAIEACSFAGKISIETQCDNDFISLFISNDGKEIPQEDREKIFEQDYTTKQNGNGVGLSFCRKQLQNAGGNICLVKSDDLETVFEIKIKNM